MLFRRFTIDVIDSDPDRPNVVISLGDPAAGPTIAMNGHLDTVPFRIPSPGGLVRSIRPSPRTARSSSVAVRPT